MTILLVDDNRENLCLLETLLHAKGYGTASAVNGVEALEKLRADRFDMIIADILMPVMDGFQLCRAVKADEKLTAIPFVFYTATYTDERDEQFALGLGAERFVRKPVEVDEFLAMIRGLVGELEEGRVSPRWPAPEDEGVILKQYNERLVRKLEKKMLELEREVAERKRVEEALRVSERELAIKNELAGIFLTVPDDQMYGEVLKQILNVTRSEYGIFGYIDEKGDWVCPSMTRDVWDQCRVAEKDLVFRRQEWGGIWGRALQEKKTFWSNELLAVPQGHIPMTRALCVPILYQGATIGGVIVGNKEEDYQEGDRRLLENIAGSIAPILYSRLQRDREGRARDLAEAELKASEERYRDLVENVTDVIFAVDGDGVVTYVSPAVEALGGYLPTEIVGRVFTDFVFKDDVSLLRDLFRARMSGDVEPKEYRLLTKSGETRWVRTSSRPNRRDGRVQGLTGTMTDITESKSLQAQLLQSQKMEAIGRLTGGIAHDFNNMLAVIVGYSELLLTQLDGRGPVYNGVANILESAMRAGRLTKQLLAFSRKQVLHPVVLDLNGVVENTERMLKRMVGEDVEIVRILEPALWRVRADPGQIEQVIMNLAVNARDAMPDGGKLTIQTNNVILDKDYVGKHMDVLPGPYVMIAVSDTGIGMDAETQKHIFEPFFTTKERDKGTGLGLAMVYGIVNQSEGHIWVYSEPHRGTTFKIYLPRVGDQVEEARQADSARDVVGGAETVLLVEDDSAVRAMIRSILKREGYKVLDAPNAEEAILHAEVYPGPIHLLITDVVMPKLSGRELAGRLAPAHPEMRVLYMSGYTDDAIVRHGVLQAGAFFIEKPFPVAGLLRKVREAIEAPKAEKVP